MTAIDRDFTMVDLEPLAAAADITSSVLVQTIASADETPYLLDVAHESDLVAGIVGWCDLEAPDVSDRLAQLRCQPGGDTLVGIRHPVQAEPDDRWLDRCEVRRSVAAVGAAGLVFDLLVGPTQWNAAARIVRDLDDVVFVLDHLGKPALRRDGTLDEWTAFMEEISACPNVNAKVSGLVTESDWDDWSVEELRPVVDAAWSLFGPDRLMFGSDWPVCLLATEYTEWVGAVEIMTADASREELRGVFGDNARRVYGLEPGDDDA